MNLVSVFALAAGKLRDNFAAHVQQGDMTLCCCAFGLLTPWFRMPSSQCSAFLACLCYHGRFGKHP